MARLIDADEFIKELYSEFYGMISDESLKIYQIIQRINAAETVNSVPLCELKYISKFLSDDKQLLSRGKRDLELLIKTYEEC